jgi:hypothetical protein
MPRIKLIVTGDMEKLALHESLQRFFPDIRDGEEVIWEKPRKAQCVTSHRLIAGNAPSGPMLQLARAMFDEAGIGKKGMPADLVVIVDDVELGNLAQEHIIAAHFRTAVTNVLSTYNGGTQTRYRALLRDRCSFHLLKPMVESYLFGDAAALAVAGVPAGTDPRLCHPTDVEEFESNDPAWLPTCEEENTRKHSVAPWWSHQRHPKHYLEHLAERQNVFYEEVNHGKRALVGLDWQQVPRVVQDTPIIRSLFEDLSDWFCVPNPLGVNGLLDHNFYPSIAVNRANLLLRNM